MPEVDSSPNTADQSLLQSYRAWSKSDFFRASKRFSPAWRDRLREASDPSDQQTPEEAWAELYRNHGASSRPDPSRVHPTWFVRALKNESPAVRLAVTAHAPASLREALCRGLNIDPADLKPDHPPHPEALNWALSLWSERLVGDVPPRRDDPAVIVALTRCSCLDIARLIKVCGLVKHSFAVETQRPSEADEAIARFTPLDRVRFVYFRRHIRKVDPRLGPLARADFEVIEGDFRRAHSRLGLVTFGRLLSATEQHRARWAVQHIPYPVARRMRIKENQTIPLRALVTWESWVLEAAWARLLHERRLTHARGAESGDDPGETS